MNVSLHNRIRRTGLAIVAVSMLAMVGAGSALALDRPAASFYTKKQIQAMSQSWAAKGRLPAIPNAATFYTPQQIQAMSQSWAAKARVSVAQARRPTVVRADQGGGFDWGDFGIGAAAMLGLVLLGVGLVAGAHYSRRTMRARPVS